MNNGKSVPTGTIFSIIVSIIAILAALGTSQPIAGWIALIAVGGALIFNRYEGVRQIIIYLFLVILGLVTIFTIIWLTPLTVKVNPFIDQNSNGIRDGNEYGIGAGIDVVLLDSNGFTHSATTDNNGIAEFSKVPRGAFGIKISSLNFSGDTGLISLPIINKELAMLPSPTVTPVPMPTNTPIPTDTPIPTEANTPTITPTPVPGEFEISTEYQEWGDYPESEHLVFTQGVRQSCNIGHLSKCSLEAFALTEKFNEGDQGFNFYVAREFGDAPRGTISIWVYVPAPSPFCEVDRCSTAKIIVWNLSGDSTESAEAIKLDKPGWVNITLGLQGRSYDYFGVHFFIVNDYKGPFNIDSVTITP